MRRLPVTAAAIALLAAACVAPGASVETDDATGGLQPPTFSPLATDTASPTPTDGATTSSPTAPAPTTAPPSPAAAPASSPTPSQSGAAATETTNSQAPAPAAPVRGRLSDGTGDMAGLSSGNAPGYADLREVTLEMSAERGTITLGFAAPAPGQGQGDEIVNVATYHDVTGDGSVDYEIWASLTSEGWGTSWYDLHNGTARFASEDDVEVAVRDGRVVLTFPPGHLGGARSGQWLASSEWGTPLTIGGGTSTTDDAPDDRSGRRWPS